MLRLPALFAALALAVAAAEPTEIPLWPEGIPGTRPHTAPYTEGKNGNITAVHEPALVHFPAPADRANGTAVVICPGGGYSALNFVGVGTRYAEWLNRLGVTCFVLRYRLKEYGHPAPLRDVLRALRIVRSRAAEFGVHPQRIGVVGSSAGGHLATSASTLYDQAAGKTGAPLDAISARPDFAVLVYPVILMSGPHVHAGSRQSLIGADPAPDLAALLSVERHVTGQTPPTFIVHAQDDPLVPIENSLAYYTALRSANVPVEMHLYEKGGHGFGLGPKPAPTAEWPRLCEIWLRSHGWLN